MSTKWSLVTGATGLLGSHVAEQLAGRGERVRALVRPGSDTAFLRRLGVELVTGDLGDPATLPPAVAGVEVVYHCAARVSAWGPWKLFQETIVDTTANLLDACRRAGARRFLHLSSSRVYGHPRGADRPLTEDEPLGQNLWRLWDYYPRAKIAAEGLARRYPGEWTVVRPTWIYGPRDRNTLPRLLHALELGEAARIGPGDNPLNLVYASDAADGVIRAATSPAGVGQVYNLSADETLTQGQFLDALTDAMGRPRVRRRVPYWLAFLTGFAVESVAKALRVKRRLRITRHAVTLLAGSLRFSSAKARDQLGWEPRVAPPDGLRRTIDWYFGRKESADG
jgi:2-alkyl-3-oxoalkanoate reductase